MAIEKIFDVQLDPRLFKCSHLASLLGASDFGFEPTKIILDLSLSEDVEKSIRFSGRKVYADICRHDPFVVTLESRELLTELHWDRWGGFKVGVLPGIPGDLIASLVRQEGFLHAACGNNGDRILQSNTELDYCTRRGISTEGMPRVWDPVWEREVIDVSGNPGRDSGTAGIGLWPAADLWYSPACGEFMDFAAVRTLPVGEVTELSNGVLHVHLFDEGMPEAEVRCRQQVLRDHLRFDDLEARADEINLALGKRGNPVE